MSHEHSEDYQLINIAKAFIKVIFQSSVEETYTTQSEEMRTHAKYFLE